jgi:hypothetical protein
MAKHNTFNVGTLFGAASSTINGGGTVADAIKASRPLAASASLRECVAGFMAGEDSKDAIGAGQQALADRASTLLVKSGIEVAVDNKSTIATALRPLFWEAAGYEAAVPKTEDKALYDKIAQRLGRMVRAIVGEQAPEKAAVRVPREAMDLAIAMVAFDAKIVTEALKRARKAAKQAK